MATIETLRPGDRIAEKYVVERVLGQGGMGVVVAARHVDLDQLVAIKFILPDAVGQPGVVERLLREARASAKLRSEHVARVTDVGRSADGAPYLVMELLEGRDLSQIAEERGMLPPGEAAHYVAQACEAIAEAHAAGIIHRDIKPANLFLTTRRDGSPCVKVLDFGIAKEDNLANAAMTSTGSLLGTPLYMSPEQVRSSKTATPATDIWALGVTLYELTTGNIPYDVTTVTELIAKILTEAPVPLRQRNPAAPPELEAIVMRCLQVDPAKRYLSAADLQRALAAFAQLPAMTTRVVGGGTMPILPAQSAIAAIAPSPVSALTPALAQPTLAVPATQVSEGGASGPRRGFSLGTESGTSQAIVAPKKSSRAPLVALVAVGVGLFGGGAAFLALREPPPPATSADASPTIEPGGVTSVTVGSAAAPSVVTAPTASAAAMSSASPVTSSGPAAPPPGPAASPSGAPAPSAKGPPPAAGTGKKPPAAKPPVTAPPPPPPSAKPGWGGML